MSKGLEEVRERRPTRDQVDKSQVNRVKRVVTGQTDAGGNTGWSRGGLAGMQDEAVEWGDVCGDGVRRRGGLGRQMRPSCLFCAASGGGRDGCWLGAGCNGWQRQLLKVCVWPWGGRTKYGRDNVVGGE